MSYKYIPQLNNENFVYPNYDLAEYDVDILHNVDNDAVSGTCSSFSATSIASSAITIQYTYSWSKNGAEVFIGNNGYLHVLSVHGMVAGQTYYKPFRCVDLITDQFTGITTKTGTTSFTITPSQMGETSFTSGTYYFELRFIGLKSIYPVCQTLSITVP